MSFHRTILGMCTAVFATVFASAAFAQCCGGVAVAPVVAPVAVVQEVIQPVMAVQPVIPAVPVVAAPIAVDNWEPMAGGAAVVVAAVVVVADVAVAAAAVVAAAVVVAARPSAIKPCPRRSTSSTRAPSIPVLQ